MLYSLARFRHFSPPLPCHLGGVLLREDEVCRLRDADHSFELEGPFEEFITGDVIRFRANKFNGVCVTGDQPELLYRPAAFQNPTGNAEVRNFAAFVRDVRTFFVDAGLSEIHTPTLVRCPGLEPSLEAFTTEVKRGRAARTAYLPTSPEIHLKKALARGYTDIFEIKTCFRRGEFSEHHENEFFMLEWYRAFAGLALIAEDLQRLLDRLSLTRKVKPLLRETTWRELFLEHLNFALTPTTTAEELRALCRTNGVHAIADDSLNDLFYRLVIDKLEPNFAERGPLLVRDFPPSQAALAKLTEEGWADRFEFYWNGLEIANAFNEVTEPGEQRRRWQLEQDERRHLGTAELPLDEELITLMRHQGIPPAGGIALGVERLFMAFHGIQNIESLKLFTTHGFFTKA